MVKQHERFGARFAGNLDAFFPRRVSPAAARFGELFRRVLRIVYKDVRAFGELAEIVLELCDARLVIRGVHDGSRGCFDAESQTALGMVEPAGRDFVLADFKAIAALSSRNCVLRSWRRDRPENT